MVSAALVPGGEALTGTPLPLQRRQHEEVHQIR
jgi:hypothetical protein